MKKMTYYDIRNDLKQFPDAWCYLIWSSRGPGKTYSTLRMCIEDKKKFMFMKRTIEDVKLLCASGARSDVHFDVSPFVPLNRDFGWDIKPVKIEKGIAGFYHCNEDGKPCGDPVGYACALSAAKDIKGFDLSICEYMIFDEFIPKKHERINRNEGDQLLDIYMTVRRDRLNRGREELKLICLANATSVNNPTFNILNVIDQAVLMDVQNTEFHEERGILMHKIPAVDVPDEEKTGIELAMAGTAWADMAFGGHFAYDDFSAVAHRRLKGYRPLCSYTYKKETTYIYEKDGNYYACDSKASNVDNYDLSRENQQKKFFYDFIVKLRDECIEDKFYFQKYTQYDLIVNYKKIFEI
ncbi:MAG: phage DNA encapsidation protein [Bacteroidales bacterium]|nr:phage DNA encapsidation protein [Bacteroidales bacterium]